MLETLREARLSLHTLLTNLIRKVRRTQPVPALMRLIAGLTALVALLTAAPDNVLVSSQAGLLVPFALGVALYPRTRFVSATAVVAVLLWLLTTITRDDPPSLARVGLLAAGLYLMHSSAALAAVLPYDASVARPVLLRWAARVSLVTVTGVGVGLGGMALAGLLTAQRSIVGPVVGSGIAVLLVGVLALQLRRSR